MDLDICGGGHRVPSYATADALVLYYTVDKYARSQGVVHNDAGRRRVAMAAYTLHRFIT